MRRLDGTSAFMIYNDIPACYQHTLKIAVLDYRASENKYNHQRFIARFERAMNIFPMLRWKIARVPFGLNHPVWVEDLNFDILHHVRRIACPKPGNRAAFCDLVSELYAQTLDKSLPLWQLWVVEGLEDDKVALVTMLHHAYADGIGAGMLLQGMAAPEDHTPQSSRAYGVNPDKNPSRLALLIHGLIDLPMIFIREIPPLVKATLEQRKLDRAYVASGNTMPPKPRDAPDSPLLDMTFSGKSRRKNAFRDPMLPNKRNSKMHQLYHAGTPHDHPYVSPIFGDFKGLPPILGQVGSIEILLDDTKRAASCAKKAGSRFYLEIWEGMPHVWHILNYIPEAQEAIDRIAIFIEHKHLDAWP